MKNMFRSFLLFVFMFTSFSFSKLEVKKVSKGIQFKKISLVSAISLAKKEKKSVFIYFHAVWCGPCKTMAKTTFLDKKVADLFNKEFVNIKMDIEEEEAKSLIAEHQINSVPFFLILDTKGKLIKKARGYYDATNFLLIGEESIKLNK